MLKEIEIENFRSIKKAKVELSPITLLIGPNNGGKTNFFRALKRLSSFLHSFEIGIGEHYNNTMDLSKIDKSITFKCRYFSKDEELLYRVSARYRNFLNESCVVNKKSIFETSTETSGSSLFKHQDNHTVKAFINDIQGLQYYALNPGVISQTNVISEIARIHENGYGIADALDHLRGEYPEIYEKIEQELKRCVPEIDRILLKSEPFKRVENGYDKDKVYQGIGKTIGIKEKHLERKFYGGDVSDGILLFLAILVIGNYPGYSRIVCIEEPENGIHPRRINNLVDHLTDLAYHSENPLQIIMSTHSPYLLSCFKDRLDEVIVVEKENGETIFKPLSEHKDVILFGSEEDDTDGLSLGDIWYSGLVGGVPK